ncbi:PREDICTED: uncharacterized protein LOC105451606 isoform X2 [Wasmannia auropunctata]|uniref:uncharacterized protein LOC105451606 isoform X2 n=1 Tax=Wasmannia auropunctata TaxID=64793 RepID=UPI0005ED5E7B|nr:PREDICTED: uncharacterized protein LOC105451606 isoform X2 [Wasmannia auropunctata]
MTSPRRCSLRWKLTCRSLEFFKNFAGKSNESSRETRRHVQSSGQYMYKKKESKKKASTPLQTDCKESQSSARREDKETGKASKSRSWESSKFRFQHGKTPEGPALEVFTSDTSSNDDIPDESQRQMMFVSDIPAACLASTLSKYMLTPKELFDHGYPIEIDPILYPGYAMINNVSYPSGPKIDSDSGQYSNSSSSDNSEQESSSDNEKNFDGKNSAGKEKSSDGKSNSENEEGRDSMNSSDNERSLDDKKRSGNEKGCDIGSSSDSEKSPDSKKSSGGDSSCDSGSNSGSEKSPSGKKGPGQKKSRDREGLNSKRLGKREKGHDNESGFDSEKSPNNRRGSGGSAELLERTCVRCDKVFHADQNGEYLSAERCVYHCGKLYNRMTNDSWYWTCCNQARFSRGCTEWKLHVWTGLVPGVNGPFPGYVQTRPSPVFSHNNNYGVYALDCEMCFTLQGLELARVSLVDIYGQTVYDTLVNPSAEIIDYNTKFSGLTEADMLYNVTKTLPEVQTDLLNFIHAETILMGHGLGNDLKALRLIHKNVVDTCVMFPHYLGLPYRNGLKTLARRVLNQKIQEETHNSIEDALVVKDLVLRKAHYEWNESLLWQMNHR